MITKVSNTRTNRNHTVFIGRSRDPYHFGNPFPIGAADSEKPGVIFDREGCILAFHDWLEGTKYKEIEQDRRTWILDNLETLRGQTLGCFCAPKACHGDVYRKFLGEITYEQLLELVSPTAKQKAAVREPEPLQGNLL